MRGVRTLVAVVMLVAAVSVVVPAERADAANLNGACDPGEWCVYKDSDFRGCVLDYADVGGGNMGDTEYANCRGNKVKDSVSSYRNGTPWWLLMWEHPGGMGFSYCVAPGATGNVLRNFNDKASEIGAVYAEDFHSTYGGEGKCNHVDRD